MAFWFEQPYKNLWRSIWCYSKTSLDHNRIWWPCKLLLLPFLCITVLKSVQRFMVKIRENEKEKHVDLMWFGKLPTSTEQERGLSLCIKLGLHKRVFILTLREEDFHYVFSPLHSTSLRYAPTFAHFSALSFTQIWATYYNTLLTQFSTTNFKHS